MKYALLTLVLCVLASACGTKSTTETTTQPSLTLKWQTEPQLTTCESVIYDKANDVLYVSNINGAPDGKDGNGFISKVGLDGTITTASWATGMDAPKGLGLYNGKLYVADIDKIHEVDVTTGKISNTYPVSGAQFLNDVTVDGSGKVFVSDSNTGNIYLLQNGKVSTWMSGIQGPNGLLSEGTNMLMLSWPGQTFNSIDTASKQITMKADSIENPDGIEAVGDGTYLISSWNGIIRLVSTDGKTLTLLDTRADSVSSADIEFIPEKNLLLIPTFFKNRVTAYELKK